MDLGWRGAGHYSACHTLTKFFRKGAPKVVKAKVNQLVNQTRLVSSTGTVSSEHTLGTSLVVKNPPCNAGDAGSIAGPHMPLSPCTTAREPTSRSERSHGALNIQHAAAKTQGGQINFKIHTHTHNMIKTKKLMTMSSYNLQMKVNCKYVSVPLFYTHVL